MFWCWSGTGAAGGVRNGMSARGICAPVRYNFGIGSQVWPLEDIAQLFETVSDHLSVILVRKCIYRGLASVKVVASLIEVARLAIALGNIEIQRGVEACHWAYPKELTRRRRHKWARLSTNWNAM